MIAEVAGELVAKFIEKSWPSDKKDVYEILTLGINKAWQEGKWLGMTAEFTVKIQKDEQGQAYFIAPPSHPTLLAINGRSPGLSIRDRYFMFHRNGYGDIRNGDGCSWNRDVYDLGSSSYFTTKGLDLCNGVRIGVRALGSSGPNEKIFINGHYKDGNRIYTYEKNAHGNPNGCSIGKDQINTINGVSLKITSDFNYINNIIFSSISSISKSITRTPVEIIAIDSSNNAVLIARLEPNQTVSKYRKYLVPNNLCGKESLHGLFKIGQQEEITQPNDEIMISNREALISLAKAIHFMYYKEQVEAGSTYFVQAISVLDKEKREEESPTEFPIQVDVTSYSDLPQALKYFQ